MSKRTERYFNELDLPKGQTVIITGGNSGIGFECARYLARLNDHVILAVRSISRGEDAKRKILEESPKANISIMELDLSSLGSVESFAKRVIEEKIDVDVFYANAGVYRVPFSTPYKGLECHMAVNFASNYYLYEWLKEYLHTLSHPVKFILTSSVVARNVSIQESDLYGVKPYKKSKAYDKSKLAVNHLYRYMCKDAQGTNVITLMVHPGVTYTPLIAKAYPGKKFSIAARRFLRLFFHTPNKAALCTMRLLAKDIQSPCFCGPRGIGHTTGYPKIYKLYTKNMIDEENLIKHLKED